MPSSVLSQYLLRSCCAKKYFLRARYAEGAQELRGKPEREINKFIAKWCNGSRSDFGSDDYGSSPCRKTSKKKYETTLIQSFIPKPINRRG
ncbi:MAG: hypothetical protein V4594_17695 [Bacteroidota bacterium]